MANHRFSNGLDTATAAPQVVIYSFGTNDAAAAVTGQGGYSLEETQTRAQAFINRAKDQGARCIIWIRPSRATALPEPTKTAYLSYIQSFNDWLTATENNSRAAGTFPHFLTIDWGAVLDANPVGYTFDLFHPNLNGGAELGARARGWRIAAGGLALASFAVQLLPLLVSFDVYLQISDPAERYFTPAASPIVAQLRIWAGRTREYWWRAAGGPPGTALLVKDFSYSEGDRSKGELLPRWTYADATVQLNPAGEGGLDGTLWVADHRPWPLARANFELRLNNAPLPGVERTNTDGDPIRWTLRFRLTPEQLGRGARLQLHSDTWNPTRDTQDNPRNEDLGLLVEKIELRQGGQPLALREALPIPPPRMNRRAFWLWTQDVPNHHLFDLWEWYVLASGMPSGAAALLLALLGLPALALAIGGARGLRATLRA